MCWGNKQKQGNAKRNLKSVFGNIFSYSYQNHYFIKLNKSFNSDGWTISTWYTWQGSCLTAKQSEPKRICSIIFKGKERLFRKPQCYNRSFLVKSPSRTPVALTRAALGEEQSQKSCGVPGGADGSAGPGGHSGTPQPHCQLRVSQVTATLEAPPRSASQSQ